MSDNERKQGATRAVLNLGRATKWGFKLAQVTASRLGGFVLDVWYWVVDILIDIITG